MRIIFSLIFVWFLFNNVVAQDALYYFKSEENGLVGVRNNKGKIIVAPIFEEHAKKYSYNEAIPDETIEFTLPPKNEKLDFSKVSVAFGRVYNREGDFLYTPLFYDNGPDYWFEGVRRYVENGKVGLVDSAGNKLTKADWDMVWPFNEKSQAQVFIGDLKHVYKNGSEHPTIVGHAITYLINTKGERLSVNKSIKFQKVNPPVIKPQK